MTLLKTEGEIIYKVFNKNQLALLMSVNGMGSDAPLIRSVESQNSEPGESTT